MSEPDLETVFAKLVAYFEGVEWNGPEDSVYKHAVKALDAIRSARHTGEQQLREERDAAERQCASAERFANQEGIRADKAEAERDAARADLLAAQGRITALEAEIAQLAASGSQGEGVGRHGALETLPAASGTAE